MKLCIDKQCRRLGEDLPFSEFPVNRKRQDGRYVYCKECCLRRTHEQRAAKRARKAARKEALKKARIVVQELERKQRVLSPLLRVKAAIYCGNRTREQIEAATELEMEVVCDKLAELAFDHQSVKIVSLGSEKVFVPRAA
jgi:hypothetical protein